MEQLRRRGDKVFPGKLIWFSQVVPHYSFIVWLALRNRLSTGDCTQVCSEYQFCRLCGESNESHDHLFFAFPSYKIWTELTWSVMPRPGPDWSITVTALMSPRLSSTDSCLLRLIPKVVIHRVWREWNSRKPTSAYCTAHELTRFIEKTICNHIFAMQECRSLQHHDA